MEGSTHILHVKYRDIRCVRGWECGGNQRIISQMREIQIRKPGNPRCQMRWICSINRDILGQDAHYQGRYRLVTVSLEEKI